MRFESFADSLVMEQRRRMPLLEVEGLSLATGTSQRPDLILDDVSLRITAGEARGFVGESGSGKSMTLRAIMGILPSSVRVHSGVVRFEGEEILSAGGGRDQSRRLDRLRGTGIAMVFQEPSVALNPVMRVGEQIVDAVRAREHLPRRIARQYALELMDRVGIKNPAQRIDAYPFELSGGMRQRVMIAAAVAAKPRMILCDEPTTALDVTVQRQILRLFAGLRDELDAALLFVTHDLAVVSELCDSISVLYAGKLMETRRQTNAAIAEPSHPYTDALLRSTPDIDNLSRRLKSIPGSAPSLGERPAGCPFAPRCVHAQDDCGSGAVPDASPHRDESVYCRHPLGQLAADPNPGIVSDRAKGSAA